MKLLLVLYNNLRRSVQDLLDDYLFLLKGNLNYEFSQSTGSKEGEANIQSFRKKQKNMAFKLYIKERMDNDKMEVKKIYVGLVFLYAGKQEIIPVVQSVDNLEYEVTIKKIVTDKKKKIGFLTGNDETDYKKMNRINEILLLNMIYSLLMYH